VNIECIYICPEPSADQVLREKIELVAGQGIIGDRNYGLSKWPGQNLTLIEAEVIEAFIQEQNLKYDLSITRRNIITRGVRLNDLVGKEFMVGEVRLRGVELCEPCSSLGNALSSSSLPPKNVVERFHRRGGLRADVLTSGAIVGGAKIVGID